MNHRMAKNYKLTKDFQAYIVYSAKTYIVRTCFNDSKFLRIVLEAKNIGVTKSRCPSFTSGAVEKRTEIKRSRHQWRLSRWKSDILKC